MSKTLKSYLALLLVLVLGAGPVLAGITVTGADGITVTGADGVVYDNPTGITVTGADGVLSLATNGISVNGITVTGADGPTVAGPDGFTYTGANALNILEPTGITVTGADGITVTGADGITVTGADGNTYNADSLVARRPTGITVTGADGITVTGADGVETVGANGITVTGADGVGRIDSNGITVTGADALVGTNVSGITITGADDIAVTGTDGAIYEISPDNVTIAGPAGVVVSGANGIAVTGTNGITVTGADSMSAATKTVNSGIQSVDPELAVQLNRLTDDSNVNAVVVYYELPSDDDIARLQGMGIVGGTRYRALPLVALTATKKQLLMISHLQQVRSIYGNRTLQPASDANMALNNAAPVSRDTDLTKKNSGLPVSGRGVTVAVLDTGLDSTHSDLSGRVVHNVKLADTQSLSAGFLPPVAVDGLPNTDQAYGHGTFVSGIIAGNGSKSGGKYSGLAPGAQLVGLSAGDFTLSYVLAGFDYLLGHAGEQNVRVLNCSFSANTVFDFNDPVNIATKLLTDAGVNVVFSAGNTGSGTHSLNPYAVAPWVIGVGATDERGRLAGFSSRGDFGSLLFQPTLVAPGVSVAGLRTSSSPSLVGALGLAAGNDLNRLSPAEIPFYTTGSGTSFSAPQVAGAIALMLEINPGLTPPQVRDILKRTATPMPGNYSFEVGAGMLNTYGAVVESAFQHRRTGAWRAALGQEPVTFVNDPMQKFSGTVLPGNTIDASINVPSDALFASVQVGWGSLLSVNELGLAVFGPDGKLSGQSNAPLVPGITGGRESVGLTAPASGTWTARVTGAVGTPQSFSGLVQITRVQYGPLKDLTGLSADARAEVLQMMRTFVMTPVGARFRSEFTVSRADLAETLVRGGRAAQYLPPNSHYTDVSDLQTMLFVESVQASASAPLFYDATIGGRFRPLDRVDRLTAAVALVRGAGLRTEAEARSGIALPYSDVLSIPSSLRGYVATAVSHGLISADTLFRPQSPLTRGELAHAMAAIAQLNG